MRLSNPALSESRRQALVNELMEARRLVKAADDTAALKRARAQVQAAKVALGERGPVWWRDGAPHHNHHLVANSFYADWFENRGREANSGQT
ncbi:hypothetical protein [Phytopseudomonas punonensis]|uniref:hypothetical protein n=1 Tax=Phytopseudomonas punonensis TaxID=1220495 RepID=UPI0026AFCB7C